jgi:hypothetical protein
MKKILSTLIIVVVLAACSDDPAPPPPPPPAEPSPYFGTALKLSGNVHTRNINSVFISYPAADKSLELTISDGGLGGSGKVKNGQFSYSIGIPPDEYLISVDELLLNPPLLPGDVDLPNIDIEMPSIDARAVSLNLIIADDPEYLFMTRENIGLTLTSYTITSEVVSYIYINKTVTITVPASTYDTVVADIPVRLNISKIDLNLKEGWNAMHSTFTLPLLSMSGTPTGDLKIKLGNPSSHKWVLNSVDDVPFPAP